jgi:hypothetical protein
MRTRLTERDLSRIVKKVKGELNEGELNEGVLGACMKDDFKTPQSVTIDSNGRVTFSNGYKCSVDLYDGK